MINPQMKQQTDIWARYQIQQLQAYYPGLQLDRQTPEVTCYRLPLLLSSSKSRTPLYLRLDCPANFPIQRPQVAVMARVLHPSVHPKTKVVSSPQLEHWDISRYGSNVLSVVREIHGTFDADPPIPEKLLAAS